MKAIQDISLYKGLRFGVLLVMTLLLIGCGGGGGGGNDVDIDKPFSGDTGTGADGIPIFWQYFGEIGGGNAVEQTADGGFVFAGEQGIDYPFVTKDLYLAKADTRGSLEWHLTFGDDKGQTAKGVKICPDGGYIAVGYTDSGSSRDALVVKTDSTGTLLWSKTYDAQGGDDMGYAICVLSNGYAIAGIGAIDSGSDGMVPEAWFFKIDTNGNKVSGSDRFYDFPTPGWYAAYAMEKTRDNGFIMTGRGEPGSISAIKIAEDGTLVWKSVYGTGVGYAVKQAPSPDDGFLIAGSTTQLDSDGSDVLIIKLDANGSEQWRRVFGGGYMDVGRGIALTADGGYLIAGVTESFSQGDEGWMRDDVYLIKLDANGNLKFQKVKGQTDANSELANAIQPSADGGYVIAGSSQSQVMLAKFDKNGSTVKLGDDDFTYSVPESIGLIKPGNATQIADTAITSIITPVQIGMTGLNLFINTLKGLPSTDFCDNSGSYSWNPTLPSADQVAVGDSYGLTFSNCSNSEFEAVNIGSFTLAINALADVPGDLITTSYSATVTMNPIDVTATDDAGTSNISGAVLFLRNASGGNFLQLVTTAGMPLVLTDTGITKSLSEFSISSSQSESTGAYSIGNIGEYVIVDPDYLTGSLKVTIQQPISASGIDVPPSSGKLLVEAQDGSKLTLTVAAGEVDLGVDTNGDGTIDQTIKTTWGDLY